MGMSIIQILSVDVKMLIFSWAQTFAFADKKCSIFGASQKATHYSAKVYNEHDTARFFAYLGSPMCCASIVFIAFSCEKCWLMSVCRTISMHRFLNSRKSVFCMWEKMLQSCSWIILQKIIQDWLKPNLGYVGIFRIRI